MTNRPAESDRADGRLLVCGVGPGLNVRGIVRVWQKVRDHLPPFVEVRYVPTFTQYTGYGQSDRGSRVVQAGVYCRAFLMIMWRAVTSPRTVFHIHLSQEGSTLRKGAIAVMLRLLRRRYLIHSHAADDKLFHGWVPQWLRRLLLWGLRGARRFIVLTERWG